MAVDQTPSPRLSRRIRLADRDPLATLDDALAYLAALSDEVAQHKAWQRAAALALDARRAPTRDRMAALTRQIEHALFMTVRRDPEHGGDCGEIGRPRQSAHEDVRAMASDFDVAMMSAHRKNIERYQGLLASRLSEQERRFVEQRVAEEQAALRRISRN